MDSPGYESTRSSMNSSLYDLYDGNGIRKRERHFSGGTLDIQPFPSYFSQNELQEYFTYFVQNKIRKSKILQHLLGYQSINGEEMKNYPHINAASHDTGWTALHWACNNGEKEIVEMLTNQGKADLDLKSKNGSSPIHLAISQGHHKVVASLLKLKPELVSSINEKTGWYPIHTAAYFKRTECLKFLLKHGAVATQVSLETAHSTKFYTPIHLATYQFLKRKVTVLKSPSEINSNLIRSYSHPGDDVDSDDEDVKTTYELLDILLENLPQGPMDVIDDQNHGTVMHCLAASNHCSGISIVTKAPYNHPPDVLNSEGISPLIMALNLRSLESVPCILECSDVDVNRSDPVHNLTPLQILLLKASSIQKVHLEIVDLLLTKGADPTFSDSADTPIYMATNMNLDVRLLEKFLDYLTPENINVKDKYTGDTVLHYAVANCDAMIIKKILDKGADVMLQNNRACFDYTTNSPLDLPTSDLPIQVAISNKRSLAYLNAIKNFGIEKIVESYITEDPSKIIRFLKTHLTGCAKEMHCELFRDIYHIAIQGTASIPRLTDPELNHILHFRQECPSGSVFNKTALNWANENNDKVIALELLKLEKSIHHNKQCGLECLKESLSSDALLPWIIETYTNFYEKSSWFMKTSALFFVVFELLIFSYMPFIYDYYSDVTLALYYNTIAFSNQSISEEGLWTCTGSLNSTCFEKNSSMEISTLFSIAFWVTIGTVILSTVIYLYIILKHSDPKCLLLVDKKLMKICKEIDMNEKLASFLVSVVHRLLSIFTKIFWPFLHMVRKYRYYAAEKRSDHKDLTTESDDTWNVIKTVEYGIESSIQLCLQTWLLKPFFPDITRWTSKELVNKSAQGIMNFLTFGTYPACYIERALGKILLTVISLALGVALMKSTKPGMGACERPMRTVPIFFSILAQTTARIFAFRSLILMETSIHLFKYLIFIGIHFLFIFLIKVFFEVRAKPSNGKKSLISCSVQSSKLRMMNIMKFLISGLSSNIILVHIHEETSVDRRRQYSFLSHALFFVLILVENLILSLFPFLAPSLYPDAECFPLQSHVYGLVWIICLWICSVFFQIVHYKWSHPWAALNGLRKTNNHYEFVTRLLWKSELQRIKVGKHGLHREDYVRKCEEYDNLVLEYESRRNENQWYS